MKLLGSFNPQLGALLTLSGLESFTMLQGSVKELDASTGTQRSCASSYIRHFCMAQCEMHKTILESRGLVACVMLCVLVPSEGVYSNDLNLAVGFCPALLSTKGKGQDWKHALKTGVFGRELLLTQLTVLLHRLLSNLRTRILYGLHGEALVFTGGLTSSWIFTGVQCRRGCYGHRKTFSVTHINVFLALDQLSEALAKRLNMPTWRGSAGQVRQA